LPQFEHSIGLILGLVTAGLQQQHNLPANKMVKRAS